MFVWALVVVTLSELSVVSFLSLSTSKAPLRDCEEGPWAVGGMALWRAPPPDASGGLGLAALRLRHV